jgi:hypothetical protein
MSYLLGRILATLEPVYVYYLSCSCCCYSSEERPDEIRRVGRTGGKDIGYRKSPDFVDCSIRWKKISPRFLGSFSDHRVGYLVATFVAAWPCPVAISVAACEFAAVALGLAVKLAVLMMAFAVGAIAAAE